MYLGRLYYNEKKQEWSICDTSRDKFFVFAVKTAPSDWQVRVDYNDGCGPTAIDNYETEEAAIAKMVTLTLEFQY